MDWPSRSREGVANFQQPYNHVVTARSVPFSHPVLPKAENSLLVRLHPSSPLGPVCLCLELGCRNFYHSPVFDTDPNHPRTLREDLADRDPSSIALSHCPAHHRQGQLQYLGDAPWIGCCLGITMHIPVAIQPIVDRIRTSKLPGHRIVIPRLVVIKPAALSARCPV